MSLTRRKITAAEIPVVKADLIKDQDYQCALCCDPLTVALGCLDHNHKSGLVRGVLCRNCNGIEGKVFNLANRAKRGMQPKDWLGRVILYWIKYETDRTGLYHPLYRTAEQKRERTNKRARAKRASLRQQKENKNGANDRGSARA